MHAVFWGLGLFILIPDSMNVAAWTRRSPARSGKGKENLWKWCAVIRFSAFSVKSRAPPSRSRTNEWTSSAREKLGPIPGSDSKRNLGTLWKLFGAEWLCDHVVNDIIWLLFNVRMHDVKHLVIDRCALVHGLQWHRNDQHRDIDYLHENSKVFLIISFKVTVRARFFF